jgi:ABC-type sugar transport system permease subunit
MVNTDKRRPGTLSPPRASAQSLPGKAAQRRVRTPGLTPRQRVAIWVRRHGVAPYLLLLPATAVIAWLVLWPAIQIGLFSFQDYGLAQISGLLPAQWVGFSNYTQILQDPEFWLSLRISLLFAVVVVPLTLIVGTLVGLLLSQLGKKMATFVSTAALLAWGTPAVSGSVIFAWLTDPDGGIVDWTLSKLPPWLGGGPHWSGFSWENSVLPAYAVLTVLLVWTSYPFVAVTVLAGLRTMPAELLEAARVDGANSPKVLWRVVIPVARPAIATAAIFAFLAAWGDFLFAETFTNSPSVLPASIGIYNLIGTTTTVVSWAEVMAGSLILGLPALLAIAFAQRYVVAGISTGALKG